MWYLTPKSDLRFLEKFKLTTSEFIAARATAKRLQEDRSTPRAIQPASDVKSRDTLRTQFSQEQVRATWLAKKYKVQVVFSVWIHTVALQQAQIDAFTAINESAVSPVEVERRAIDTIDRCIGACKDQMRQDFWHLINPLYWVYSCFHTLFVSSGLSKPLGESVTKVLAKALTAGSVVAAPWLKQLLEVWFKRLTG